MTSAKSKEDLTNSMTTLIVFDFDGVLFDAFDSVWKLLKQYFNKHHFTKVKTKQDFRNLFHTNFYTSTEQLGFDICHTPKLHNDIMSIMKTMYDPPIFPHTAAVIRELAQQHTLAVESSNYENVMRRLLAKYGLEKYFAVVAGADSEPSKAKRLRYLLQHIKPSKALFVTDTVGDIIEAQEAGIPALAVSWGYHTYRQLKKAQPLYVARTPKELVQKIKDYFG